MTKAGNTPTQDTLSRLQDAIRHRGPDGEGRYAKGAVGLVHTRLAIIDTEHGQQPFVSSTGCVLVANGEIYNDPEIRSRLSSAPYSTQSDNESVLHLYVRHGLEFAKHLRGMYAVALFDPAEEHLVLARDPYGIKPLYYADTPNGFWFASEPQALLNAGLVERQENSGARDRLLGLQFVSGAQTAFEGIRRLEPGEMIVVKAGKIIERRGGENWPQTSSVRSRKADEFDDRWMESVDLHRRSDVPYGVFLSSGIDSAALLTAMTRLEDQPMLTFTAGFAGARVHDERQQAARLAASLGSTHTPIEIDAKAFWDTLPAIAKTMDDPVADYAVVPTYLLAKEAAKSVKVVLTGEGGDEVFAGYGRYRAGRRFWPFRKTPWSRHVLAKTGVLRLSHSDWRSDVENTEHALSSSELTRLQQLQALDIAEWLPNDLLTKVDRCLMAHGVEGRVPFLDGPLASYGFHLPDHDKISGRIGKQAVRAWLHQNTPESRPFDRKKGFSVPVGEWIAAKGGALGPLVARQPGVSACCDTSAVESLFKTTSPDKALAVWVLLFYALWHQCHILGTETDGTVFDVLAERISA